MGVPGGGEEKYFAEKHSKLIMLRMRSNFSHEVFRISLVVELIYDLLCFASKHHTIIALKKRVGHHNSLTPITVGP
jgi:hypothetical protein